MNTSAHSTQGADVSSDRPTNQSTSWPGTPWLFAAALVALVGGALVVFRGGGTPRSPGEQASDASAAAPALTFELYQGSSAVDGASSLSDLEGRPVVLNFWAGLCPPCRAELPEFQRFHDAHGDEVAVVGIDVGAFTGLGDEHDAKRLLEETGVTFANGATDDPAVMRRFNIVSMPTTVFIDARGRIVEHWGGVLNQSVLNDQLPALTAHAGTTNSR